MLYPRAAQVLAELLLQQVVNAMDDKVHHFDWRIHNTY